MMGRRVQAPTCAFIWILLALLAHLKAEANPEPHPEPASPLTGLSPRSDVKAPRIIEGPQGGYFAKNEPASLDCKAEGVPAPNITWYQNGQLVRGDHHRMILLNGQQLFFLRIIHSKSNRPDVGTYHCVATNDGGSVRSENATLKIAVIRDDFRQEPVDTTAIPVQSTAVLHCRPPRGEPEPTVSWHHNSKPVEPDDRVMIHEDGDLIINDVSKQDAGEYMCVATNKAGERRSSAAQLTVQERPVITQTPEDVTAHEGSTIEFQCRVATEKGIKVNWKKEGGGDTSKWRLLSDNSLRIEKVDAEDAGGYICIAENRAGYAEAKAHLTVEFTPTFLVRPKDQTLAAGRTATFQCSAIGNPNPTIYWRMNSSPTLLFMNYEEGRFSVAEDGTLRIEQVEKADEGTYTCRAINTIGEAEVEAHITVKATSDDFFPENDFRPPPVIVFGPQNQTLSQDGIALLRCKAEGSPPPTIRWYKHGKPLQRDPRYTNLNTGTLQISSLKISDTGRYTCRAVSETGETTAEATLIVELQSSDRNEGPPDTSTFPDPPGKPVVSDVTDNSVRLSWERVRNDGASRLEGYQVEYFGYGYSQTWEVVNTTFKKTDVVIDRLVPNTTYVFLVRARNQHGVGAPSVLSDLIQTLGKSKIPFKAPKVTLPRDQVERLIRQVDVQLTRGIAINSSAIHISWKVKNELNVVDGFVMQYKHILNIQTLRYGVTLQKPIPYRPLSYTITGLESYEFYEICIMAASGSLTSRCSSPMKIQTGESVPAQPPVKIAVQRESKTQILVSWSPPDITDRKGEIVAYHIKCFSEDESHNCSLTTNGSTHRVHISNLIAGVNYNIQMAAQTQKGIGKWSSSYSIAGPEQADITKETWFIGMIVAIGCILWVALCIFTIWLCRSRKQRKKLKEQWYTGGTSEKSAESVNRKGGYGIKDGNFQDSNDSGLPQEFSTLLQQSQHEGDDQNDSMYTVARDHPELSTFYQKSGPVTPYATTALLQAQAQNRKPNGELFRPVGSGYHQHSGGSGDSHTDRSNTTDVSIESVHRQQGSTGDSGNMSDENGMLLKQHRKAYRPGMPQNQAIVNWTEVLPPPPNHPPSDGEYLQDDQLYSEIPEDRARSPMSPVSVSQLSACSCPVSHSQPIPGYNMGVYSDNCNKCQSLRNFTNRPYSPQQLIQLQRQQGFPPNIAHHCPPHPAPSQRGGGTPVYLHGYSQPWDCQPLPRGPYDYDCSQVPRDDGYNYTQPIQDGIIDYSNTLRGKDKNKFLPQRGPHIGDSGVPQRDVMNIPGGPPGNYCEGPCRGQIEALNNLNNYNMRHDGSQRPYLDAYMIDSPRSGNTSSNEYKVVGSCGHSSGTDSGTSEKKSNLKGRSSSEGSDLKERQFHQPPAVHYSRSESSPAGQCMIDEGYARNADSPISEDPDYAEGSEHGVEHNNERDSIVANWESLEDCSSVHSSSSNVSDEANHFLNEEDFASAVAQAAVMSGLTVVGTTVSDPNAKQVKKTRKHHRHVRPPSPGYSTDSNYGTADMVHKPYPKSQRRKQMSEQGKLRLKGDNSNNNTSGMTWRTDTR